MVLKELENNWKKHKFKYKVIAGGIFIVVLTLVVHITGRYQKPNMTISNVDLNFRKNDKPSVKKFKGISAGENICKIVLENMFKEPFCNKRPNFMKNHITGKNLELDCYNEKLKLAIEYNGIQHYKFTPGFHKTRDAFRNQQYRDDIKRKLCHKFGITLIEVPYNVTGENIESYIRGKLEECNYQKPATATATEK